MDTDTTSEQPDISKGTDVEPSGHIAHAPLSNLVWLSGRSALAKYIARPIRRFIEVESSSGLLLIIATVVALIWANSPWGDSYTDLWHTEIDIKIGSVEIFTHTLGHFVNDVLMVLFFLVVGVEIKSELVAGQLRNLRSAALPVMAAIGGMAVPALVYVVLNLGTDSLDGWAIPMATDIAFALGVVALLGSRIPRSMRVFLLTLAIADDIGAIVVIAVFYTDQLDTNFLFGAIIVCALIAIARRVRIWYVPLYYALGCVLWWMTYRSGIHATIAGVAIGLLTPAKPIQSTEEARSISQWLQDKTHVYVADVRWANFNIAESVSVADRLKTYMHPFTGYIIVPIFALANGGIEISTESLKDALNGSVTAGVFFGLLVGKVVGITLFTWIAVKLKVAPLPTGMRFMSVVGVALIAGIGFTVAIFVSSLAFDSESAAAAALLSQAKIGILAASLVAALVGGYVLHKTHKHPVSDTAQR